MLSVPLRNMHNAALYSLGAALSCTGRKRCGLRQPACRKCIKVLPQLEGVVFMKKILVSVTILLIAALLAGCSFSVSSAKVTSVTPCRDVDTDGKPIGATDVFSTADTVMYVSALTANVPSDTTVTIVWQYSDGTETTDVDVVHITLDEARYIYSNLTSSSGFPSGTYTAEFYIDDRDEPDQAAVITVR